MTHAVLSCTTWIGLFVLWCWWKTKETPVEVPAKPRFRCSECRIGTMRVTLVTNGEAEALYRKPLHWNSTDYLDSERA